MKGRINEFTQSIPCECSDAEWARLKERDLELRRELQKPGNSLNLTFPDDPEEIKRHAEFLESRKGMCGATVWIGEQEHLCSRADGHKGAHMAFLEQADIVW